MIYVLFNPKSNNSNGEKDAREAVAALNIEPKFISVIGLNYKEFFKSCQPQDEVILCGGDGTVTYFANEMYGEKINCKLSYVKCGTGNDFYRDIGEANLRDGRIDLKPFISHLPLVTIGNLKRRFINNIGFGLDGQVCVWADEIREKEPGVKIDYTKLSIKLLLGKYKVRKATVEVDGKTYNFKNVWICTTMNGRYYGGGMLASPKRDRLTAKTVDLVVLSSCLRIPTLLRFPKFSAGKHEGKKWITHLHGKHIKVTFDTPCGLQIDGDTVKDVTTYEVKF